MEQKTEMHPLINNISILSKEDLQEKNDVSGLKMA